MNSYEKREENQNSIEKNLKTNQEALNQEQKPKSINQTSKDKRLMNFKSKIKSIKYSHINN